MKTIAYGYHPDYTDGQPSWFVHPKCRNTFLRRRKFSGVKTMLISYVTQGYQFKHGNDHCVVCAKKFQ